MQNIKDARSAVMRKADDAIRKQRVKAMTADQKKAVRELFDEADADKRGQIDKEELRTAVERLSDKRLDDRELDLLWQDVSHGRSELTFDDFLYEFGPDIFPNKGLAAIQVAAQSAGSAGKAAARSAAQAKEAASKQAAVAKEAATTAAEAKMVGVGEKAVKLVMGVLSKTVRKGAVDPDMPGPVARAVDYAVVTVMDDLEIEVNEAVVGRIRKRDIPPLLPWPKNCLVLPLAWLRAKFLYTLYPADKTIWRQLKDPLWWLLKIVAAVPYFGVQQAFFTVHFLLMNKRDEFQLVFFILLFKGSQFISVGFVSTIVGASIYYTAQGAGEEAVLPASYATSVLFAWQVVLVWVAFMLLPWSKSLRQPRKPEAGPKLRPGGRLGPLVLYDALVFAVCAALILAVYFTANSEARTLETIFWGRTLYGLLSLPFFFFTALGPLLTHATPTAYDERGQCVPRLSPADVAERRKLAGVDAPAGAAASGSVTVAVRK